MDDKIFTGNTLKNITNYVEACSIEESMPRYTDFPQPYEIPIKPSSCIIDKAMLLEMIENESPVSELAELSRLLGVEEPKYTIHTIALDEIYFTCTVEFAKLEFPSFFIRTHESLARDNAAGLAIDLFFKDPSIFTPINIPDVIPTICPISALKTLCNENGWTVMFACTGSQENGWRCSISVVMGENTADMGEDRIFLTKHEARLDASAVMYNYLIE
jgi:hypothetical protein